MRIGIIGEAIDLQYGGIHYFVSNLVKACAAMDGKHEFFVFLGEDSPNIPGITTIKTPYKWGFWSRFVRLFFTIPKLAKKQNLDIVIEPAHFGPFNLPKTIKKVTFIHDLTPLINRKWHPFHSFIGHKFFLKRILIKADLILTNSDYTKKDIVEMLSISSSKIQSVHLGISNIFSSNEDQRVLIEYGICKEYLLYQGTLEPRKNILNLIKGYEKYRDDNPSSNEQLILSGREGWKSRDIIRKKYDSKYSDDIILLGYVRREHMPVIYSEAKMFIYPSYYEGFGLPVLEAMACGTPIITSSTSSLPEIGSTHSSYFNPNDIKDIASSIEKGKNKSKVDLNAQVDYAKSFTWHKTAQKVIDSLEDLFV